MSIGPTIPFWLVAAYLVYNRCSINTAYDITYLTFSGDNFGRCLFSFPFFELRGKVIAQCHPAGQGQNCSWLLLQSSWVCHYSVPHLYPSAGQVCLGQVPSSKTEQESQSEPQGFWERDGRRQAISLHSKRSFLPYLNATSKQDVTEK